MEIVAKGDGRIFVKSQFSMFISLPLKRWQGKVKYLGSNLTFKKHQRCSVFFSWDGDLYTRWNR